MTLTELVTHSGGFHADEILSTVVLSRLHPDARRLRSRDPALTSAAPGRIVYDVGRAYDATAGLFDHHQKPAPLRPDGAPYSSFGLIWHHFGTDYLRALAVPEADLAALHAQLDNSLVRPIDLMDNGALDPSAAGPLAALTLPALLERMKPAFDVGGPDAEDAAFEKALGLARTVLEASVATLAARARAEGRVLAAIAETGTGRVLELPQGMPHLSAIEKAGADHLLFVVHPRDGDWALNTIRKSAGTFDSRADLPAAWAGLTDTALEQASGVPGARFCHNARFIAVAATREAVMALAEKAVAEAEA
ncbi:MYG1 family protein [Ponticoccus alexandrii]|uniref:MYG1 family protein n=1 Tax=Ponticoccus alexandrii TaxID=1943633 RepID=A0ABX7F7T1_9RHOB|nr:MYG1 family protein [Ponticoccus alexandrii]ETA50471.1 metal-dependent hydrolase [Rhodobacteraceae bacterium PD-2]QRF65634.1 MYG1 family protein [Ponticoccus alexandrii]